MKKLSIFLLIIIVAISTFAQTADKKWGFGIGGGAYGNLDNNGVGFMPELYLSRYLSPTFDLKLKSNLGAYNSSLTSNLDLAAAFLDLRAKLPGEEKKLTPYLFAGPGYLADNSTHGINFNAGLGGKIKVGENSSFYAEAGYIYGIETIRAAKPVRDDIWKITVGLEFNLGKTIDTDLDGVSDKKDQCPDTPPGVEVDEKGCPIDLDKDGVPDYLDECPDVEGLPVLNGCPDIDRDGVADKNDECPEIAGLPSLKGCPDSDMDGITDADDKCPETPAGWKVDETGCPIDSDKDGLADSEDDCPNEFGPKSNKGCPVKEPEVKKEITPEQVIVQKINVTPVHFVSDKTYLTDYSKANVDKLVITLNGDKEFKVNIFGYADSIGPDDYNFKLSEKRVETVIEYLLSKGISKERIIHQKAFGETKPVASNSTEEGRLKNRRVEFEIFKMK